MNIFVKEFRENIPYLVDELSQAFGGGSDSWSIKEAHKTAEEVLTDWLNQYQTDIERDKNNNNNNNNNNNG